MKQLYKFVHAPSSLIVLIFLVLTGQPCALAQTPIIGLGPVAGGLTQPVDIVNAGDGSNRLFIVELAGKIKVFSGGVIQSAPFLDLTGTGVVSTLGGERGLLSMAFHPDYENNGYFYIFYTRHHTDPALVGDLQISRYKVSSNPQVADPASRKDVITIPHSSYDNHNGGKLNFGHDSSLYLSTGDGGGANDPDFNGQDPTSLLGKIIRILVNDSTDVAPFYTAPGDNPYHAMASPEIFSMGLRNPFRWSFDRNGNGPWDMWIGDVGQGAWEEINFRAGGMQRTNFGWRCYEGNQVTPTAPPCATAPSDTVNPFYQYPIGTTGQSITGGIVYRGTAQPALQGWYTAIDFFSGNAWLIKADRSNGTQMQSGLPDGIAAFGESEVREIYAVSMYDGNIYQLQLVGIVPIKLISFTAAEKNGQHLLNWKTAMEENLLRFELQFSKNGSTFSTIHTAPATNKPNGHGYGFSYPVSRSSDIYYRLSIVDKDGKIEYSNTLHLKGKPATVLITPNVIRDKKVNVLSEAVFNKVDIIDMSGKLRWSKNHRIVPGRNIIDLSSLTSGIYIIRLTNGNGQVNERIIME